MSGFIQRHRSSVMGILNGFDRVRIRGTLRWLCYVDGFGKYLSAMKVRLKDFKPYAEGITDRVRRATERMAEEAGRPLQYLGSPSTSQEEVARAIAELEGAPPVQTRGHESARPSPSPPNLIRDRVSL